MVGLGESHDEVPCAQLSIVSLSLALPHVNLLSPLVPRFWHLPIARGRFVAVFFVCLGVWDVSQEERLYERCGIEETRLGDDNRKEGRPHSM